MTAPCIAFIGGGNMASAIIGGLIRQGHDPQQIMVVEPFEESRQKLATQYGLTPQAAADDRLAQADIVVWAVKPQVFREAALSTAPHTSSALHLSVAAGIRSDSMALWLGTDRIVRAMPNTPALIGQGMTGLFARSGASDADRLQIEKVVSTTGQYLWVATEQHLDTVTALSGSGPAYVFYFLEAMTQAGADMGLPQQQAYQLALGTFIGASALAQSSAEAPEVLRQRVTSKGGTTYAAISHLEQHDVKSLFMQAMLAAKQRATELGDEFGAV